MPRKTSKSEPVLPGHLPGLVSVHSVRSYFRNVTELLLFGVLGRLRTLTSGRTQVNLFSTRKQEHSRKPAEVYDLIRGCSPGPYLELFARERTEGWTAWGDEVDSYLARRPLHANYIGHARPVAPPKRGLKPKTGQPRSRRA